MTIKQNTKDVFLSLIRLGLGTWEGAPSLPCASFEAQVAMFPAMIQGCVPSFIEKYSALPEVLAWKMPGAGGGGYLACVVADAAAFAAEHPEAIRLTIRRPAIP